MTKLALFLSLVPGVLMAHGGHAPVPEPAHAVSHTGPLLGLTLICIALGKLAYDRWAS